MLLVLLALVVLLVLLSDMVAHSYSPRALRPHVGRTIAWVGWRCSRPTPWRRATLVEMLPYPRGARAEVKAPASLSNYVTFCGFQVP